MKKRILWILIIAGLALAPAFAQSATDPDPSKVGVNTSQQKLKEISVSKMEDAAFWYGVIPGDNGFIQVRAFPGAPLDKEPIEDEEQFGIAEPDVNTVGAKISFLRRGLLDFTIKPIRPLPVEGITKTISVWVVGRNTNHRLELLVKDQFYNTAVIPMGKLNFAGWKKLTVTIPPHIKQRDFHFNDRLGVAITGFNVKCNLDETYGRYYIYLDDIRAVTDLFTEESRDPDDMMDAW